MHDIYQYSLLSGLYRYLTEKVQYQVLLLGLDYAGKTTFKEQCEFIFASAEQKGLKKKIEDEKMTPTVGLNIGKLEIGRVKLLLWDLGGQEGLRVIWHNYFAEAHAVIFIVDATDSERLDEAKATLATILEQSGLKGAPFMILANKQDIPGAKGEAYIAKHLGIPEILDEAKEPKLKVEIKPTTKIPESVLTPKSPEVAEKKSQEESSKGINERDGPVRIQGISALKG
mmetsp:Transcript_9980/g.13906  ORF Transcript_9980/g.13906 Transcript_9980/m.13906 type:complete len:228 (+) Transcript_9980:118-801(+)